MSISADVSAREPVCVRIGALSMYCEKFRAEGTRSFAEKATVSGDLILSNTNRRALKLTFEGRIYDSYLPLRMILYTDAFLNGGSHCSITYRGLNFPKCRVQSYKAEDIGEDYIYASITLITTEAVTESGE